MTFISPKGLARQILESCGICVVRYKTVYRFHTKTFSAANRTWNLNVIESRIGGWMPIPNASGGYHGIMRQWWEAYGKGNKCLLVSESQKAKLAFSKVYPHWDIQTLDYYTDINGDVPDIVADICKPLPSTLHAAFQTVICQATLEHVYDPLAAVANLSRCLTNCGILALHTHTPPFMYHPCPRDYLRFNVDWFEDLSRHVEGLRLIELHAAIGHVFALYERVPTSDATDAA
jgi:SAM-dependent methyltransferase